MLNRLVAASELCGVGSNLPEATTQRSGAFLTRQCGVNNACRVILGASCRALFDEIYRSAHKPLPAKRYVFAE